MGASALECLMGPVDIKRDGHSDEQIRSSRFSISSKVLIHEVIPSTVRDATVLKMHHGVRSPGERVNPIRMTRALLGVSTCFLILNAPCPHLNYRHKIVHECRFIGEHSSESVDVVLQRDGSSQCDGGFQRIAFAGRGGRSQHTSHVYRRFNQPVPLLCILLHQFLPVFVQ